MISDSVLAKFEERKRAEWDEESVEVSADVDPVDFLLAVVRDPRQPMSRRLRAAVEAAPYVRPRLSATAITSIGGEEFAKRLERAIERSRQLKLIEHSPPPASTIDHRSVTAEDR